ncbi:MAG: hypothetical protein KF778_13135 [Rhodocyclaceae bacterium]|nr:hypothetical protein [Rhodocyclaceae bacterium]
MAARTGTPVPASFTLAEGAYAAGSILVGTDRHRRQPQQQHRQRGRHHGEQQCAGRPSVAATTDTGASGSDRITHTAGLTPSGVEAGATLGIQPGRHELERIGADGG